MNTLELEAYKAALAREVLNINNQEVLDTIKDLSLWIFYRIQPYQLLFSHCLFPRHSALLRL